MPVLAKVLRRANVYSSLAIYIIIALYLTDDEIYTWKCADIELLLSAVDF